MIAPLDSTGDYVDGFDWLTGRNAATVADDITARLRNAARVVKDELYAHSVPVCWRCKSHVLFRLVRRVVHQRRRSARADARGRAHGRAGNRRTSAAGWTTGCTTWATGASRGSGTGACRSPSTAATECNELTVVGSRAELRERAIDPNARRRAARAPPTVDRRHQDHVRVVRRAGGARPRGRRLLARRGHRPVLDARLLRRSRRLEGALPRRVDQRDARAGPPLVLLDALHERRARRARAVRAGADATSA